MLDDKESVFIALLEKLEVLLERLEVLNAILAYGLKVPNQVVKKAKERKNEKISNSNS